MILRGDRCQCRGCVEYFNSTSAFDKHRTGEMVQRKCLTEQGMRGKGMDKNAAGFWVSARMPVRPAYAFGKRQTAEIAG